jgi:hypothetical protein
VTWPGSVEKTACFSASGSFEAGVISALSPTNFSAVRLSEYSAAINSNDAPSRMSFTTCSARALAWASVSLPGPGTFSNGIAIGVNWATRKRCWLAL